jgi:hypothetical protein
MRRDPFSIREKTGAEVEESFPINALQRQTRPPDGKGNHWRAGGENTPPGTSHVAATLAGRLTRA